jgi:uncharacterized membrane protein
MRTSGLGDQPLACRRFLHVSEDNPALDTVGSRFRESAAWLHWLTAILLPLTLAVFLLATPNGLLRKADMVGYAVCHQIESHSFTIAGHQLPLCARCTGTFLGALVGLFGQAVVLGRRRAGGFPPALILAILVGFTLLWMADGLNSYLALVGGPHLYEPRNALRLTTGALNGLTMSALIYPVFNVSFWRCPADEAALSNLPDLGVLLLLEAVLIGLVLSRQDFILYPLTVLSAGGVLTLLTSVNTVIALILTRRDNRIGNWRQAIVPISVGLILSLIQIGLIGLVRYRLTGTLEGIPSLQ